MVMRANAPQNAFVAGHHVPTCSAVRLNVAKAGLRLRPSFPTRKYLPITSVAIFRLHQYINDPKLNRNKLVHWYRVFGCHGSIANLKGHNEVEGQPALPKTVAM